jgi:O6-methylguanine-DNA--protein-cysteine methyltransferase
MKPPPRPRILQPWQAYHALTYQSQWKPQVDTAWSEYKETWMAEHGSDEKPEKGRFQIMVEFMKQKFSEETEEMKKQCDEYRKPEKCEELSPTPVKSESALNTDFQA